jgi:hypothetical protein
MSPTLAPVASLAAHIASLKPEDGGYKINDFDTWLVSGDAPGSPNVAVEHRHLLARIDTDGLSLSGRTVTHRLSVLVTVSNFPGEVTTIGGLDKLTAYDVALLAGRHLVTSLAINTVFAPGDASITPAPNFVFILVPVTLTTSF